MPIDGHSEHIEGDGDWAKEFENLCQHCDRNIESAPGPQGTLEYQPGQGESRCFSVSTRSPVGEMFLTRDVHIHRQGLRFRAINTGDGRARLPRCKTDVLGYHPLANCSLEFDHGSSHVNCSRTSTGGGKSCARNRYNSGRKSLWNVNVNGAANCQIGRWSKRCWNDCAPLSDHLNQVRRSLW
jgi:hypothetical protein